MMYAFLSLGITLIMLLLSVALKAAGKLRLTLPFLYFLAISTVLNRWASAHERLALGILALLILFTVISWFVSLISAIKSRKRSRLMEEDVAWQIDTARERGIDLSDVYGEKVDFPPIIKKFFDKPCFINIVKPFLPNLFKFFYPYGKFFLHFHAIHTPPLFTTIKTYIYSKYTQNSPNCNSCSTFFTFSTAVCPIFLLFLS